MEKVPASSLFISEPRPEMFGNGGNTANDPHWNNGNWLKSRFHFSFAEYYDPNRFKFGVLRVMNDDLVQPDRGFGQHPHRDMEICTYVVDGSLTHKDSMGTEESLPRGSIQFMTAGKGVLHSEYNNSKTNILRFVQIWITPRSFGLKPNYGSMTGDAPSRQNQWAHLVSDVQQDYSSPVKINQDANIYVAEMDEGKSLSFTLHEGRQAYLLCIEGSVEVKNGTQTESMDRHDAAKLYGSCSLEFIALDAKCHLLLLEMKQA